MKLQFQNERLRLRLQRNELESLLTGEELRLALGPKAVFGECVLRANPGSSASFFRREHDVLLSAPREALAELLGRLPSKAGLSWLLEGAPEFELVLEVDIRTQRA